MSNAVKIFKHFQTPKSPGVYHRLICLTGEKKGMAYFIMDKQRVVLGRSETADIRVLDLKSSREHAEIIQVGNDFVLTDLGSQNGIVVNDLKVKQHVLSDGDKIIIGKTVYKFSKIEVKDELKPVDNEADDSEEVDEEEVKRDKKLARILMVILLLAFILFGIQDPAPEDSGNNQKNNNKVAIQEFDKSILKEVQNRSQKNTEHKESLSRYFHRGLREYREGNYFRALQEFQNAQTNDANDPTVNFYVRKTNEKINEIISRYFNEASRDMDALNYKAASTAYCRIIRLLVYNTKKRSDGTYADERIAQAEQSLRQIEKRTGQEENSIQCVRKEDEAQ